MPNTPPIPLAVVGIGCRFPGDATNPDKLWDLLAGGKSAWSRVPADRWNEDAFLHPDPDDMNGSHNHAGGHFLQQDMGEFDAAFFNVLPGEAAAMDPQQRLLLETTYEALESAGIPRESLQKSNTAVYMAIFTRDYDRNVYKDLMSIPKYHVTGTGDAILANRISHLLDLRGPSMTIDTGCSGGMAAVSHACQVLRSGECDVALAGAANLMLSPDHMVSMSNLHMLNADGRSYAFDSRGAGYGRGEGIATLVIKRLDDAIRANDPIRAILRDAALNQDGHTTGITLPSGPAQEALERQVWSNINLDPREAGYVECHGTGTLAGDQAELEGISRVFAKDRQDALVVGSIKSNIGHTECVSGLAALIKSILILERGAIPPNVNYKYPKPNLKLDERNLRVPTELQKWSQPGVARVSVNSFGYGGTNAHAVLERAERRRPNVKDKKEPRLFTLTAANQTSLQDMAASMAAWISQHEDQTSLRDVAYTLSERRSVMQWRFATVASDPQELTDVLHQASRSNTQNTNRVSSEQPRVAFVFTGQGAQWPGMGRELLADPRFHGSIQMSCDILAQLGASWDLAQEILRDKETSRLTKAELAQPATTAIQIALVDLARHWGIVPDAVVGHSSGELAAAYAAGYLSHYDAIRAAYYRGFSSAIAKSKGLGKGGMLAVGVGEDEIAPHLGRLTNEKVVVACQNSPKSVTVSGDNAAIIELSEMLTKNDVFNRRLVVDTAYHSHHMQAAAEEYRMSLGNMEVEQPTGVNMFSSVTGTLHTGPFDASYWVSNLVGKVRFCDALQSLCHHDQASSAAHGPSPPHRIFIEIGPHAALAGPLRQSIADVPGYSYSYTSALIRGMAAMESALTMAATLFTRGYAPLSMPAINASSDHMHPSHHEMGDPAVVPSLPTYAWDHTKRHWHESRLSRDYRLRRHAYHDLLGLRMTDTTPLQPVWRHMVGVDGLPWLRDHIVDGLIIFPGAGYLCMAMTAAAQVAADRHGDKHGKLKMKRMRLRGVEFLKALAIPDGRGKRVEMQLVFTPATTGENNLNLSGDDNNLQYAFSITAYNDEDARWTVHCTGSIQVDFSTEKGFGQSVTYADAVPSLGFSTTTPIDPAKLYQTLRQGGNHYGPTFCGIDEYRLLSSPASSSPTTALSTVVVPDIPSIMPANHHKSHLVHPSTLDILLHTVLPLVNSNLLVVIGGVGSVMPVRIDDLVLDVAAVEGEDGTTACSQPGSVISVVANLTRAEPLLRAAEADLFVFTGALPGHDGNGGGGGAVISVTGMELRSLAAAPTSEGNSTSVTAVRGGEVQPGRDICYEVKWGQDERFLTGDEIMQSVARMEDQPLEQCLAWLGEYLAHKTFKQSDLCVLEIGSGGGTEATATRAFLEGLKSRDGHTLPAVYDLTTPGLHKQEETKGLPVTVRQLDVDRGVVAQGFQAGFYDIVFSCRADGLGAGNTSLSNVHQLLKPGAVLVTIHDTNSPSYPKALSQAGFKPQLSMQAGNLSLTISRAAVDRIAADPLHLQFITESASSVAAQTIINELPRTLSKNGLHVAFQSTTSWDSIHPTTDNQHNLMTIVLDDGAHPILSSLHNNPTTFLNITNLLQTPRNIVWVTLSDDPHAGTNPKRHLITGVARTALAENEQLEMVLVDVQKTFASDTWHGILDRLAEIIASSFPQGDDGIGKRPEREYVLTSAAAGAGDKISALVPRVLPSATLNRQLSSRGNLGTKTLTATTENYAHYSATTAPLKLDFTTVGKEAIFIHDEIPFLVPLPEGFVEIEARAFGVNSSSGGSKDGVRDEIAEYAGVVLATGPGVETYSVGDRVVAWDDAPNLSLASRPRVPASQVQLLPEHVSFVEAAGLPVRLMAAVHGLQVATTTMTRTAEAGSVVLCVDGAASEVGQAVLCVGTWRKSGVVKLIASVGSKGEAEYLQDKFGIPAGDIISRESPFLRHQLRKVLGSTGGIDMVFGCARSSVPSEIISAQKPFGTLVHLGGGRGTALPSSSANRTVVNLDMASLLMQCKLTNVGRAAKLFDEAFEMVRRGLSVSPLKITALPLSNLSEALKMARRRPGTNTRYVVEVDETATVKVARPIYAVPRLEANATYVVAGGLGDLGQRFLRLMAKAGAQYLVTLSRSGATENQHEILEKELQRLSPSSQCTLVCVKCDVSQEREVAMALADIKATAPLPPVRGVIQASVVLGDSTLAKMTTQDFYRVLDAKAFGTLHLQRVFGPEDLTFFISLSSAVNIIGTAGQANYNAANSLQDALAQFGKAADKCFYMTLNIGFIQDATVNNTVISQSMQRQGLSAIHHDELDAYFEYALSTEVRQVGYHQLVIGFTSDSIAKTSIVNGAAKTLLFTHVGQTKKHHQEVDDGSHDLGATAAGEPKTLAEFVTQTDDKGKLEAFAAQAIANQLADLMLIEPEDVELDESLEDFGLDSLVAIELRNWIMRHLKSPIQTSEVLSSQNIRALARKVIARSTIVKGNDDHDGDASSTSGGSSIDNSDGLPSSTEPTSTAPTRSPSREPPRISHNKSVVSQPQSPLPVPNLTETLNMLADSRSAVCTPEERQETTRVINDFLLSDGPELVESLRENSSRRLDFYNSHIHLERREPLQDHALFFIGHLTKDSGAPTHSQAERAAIIAGAALTFKRRFESGSLEQHTLNDIPLCMDTLQWLFHTTQEPGISCDQAQKFPPSNKIVVMRHGHFFQVDLDPSDDYTSLTTLFTSILASSPDSHPPVSVLTSKPRNEWAALRSQLLSLSAFNADTLVSIEASAFIISLDDSHPATSSERFNSILLNDSHLSNRWLDKMLTFTVASNGVSALVGENSMLDGLSARQLSEFVTDEILSHSTLPSSDLPAKSTVRRISFTTTPHLDGIIHAQVAANLARYRPIASSRAFYPQLSRLFLGSKGFRSKGTVLMAIAMASRLFFGGDRHEPLWETVTQAKHAGGRIDWLQVLTPDVVDFVDAALEGMNDNSTEAEDGIKKDLAKKLKEVGVSHVQNLRRVADGKGYVEPLYALLGEAVGARRTPELFGSAAWRYSDRHLTPKRAKTDCLGSGGYLRMQEGGFLMPNENSVFVHYEVHHGDPLINVSGRVGDVERFVEGLERCVGIVREVVEVGA